MNAMEVSYKAEPGRKVPDPPVRSPSKRRPVTYTATLLVVATVAMSWTDLDIDRANARDGQGAAQPSALDHIAVDVRDLLDDPQREQPWADPLANSGNAASSARAPLSRQRAGD